MLRPLLLLLTLLAAALGWGGQFTLDGGTPTGGKASRTSGTPLSINYALQSGGWYGGSIGGPGSKCEGKIKYDWTWTGSGTPPPSVVLKVEAYAGWSGAAGGSCSDGIDTNYTPSYPYPGALAYAGVSQGTVYRSVSVVSNKVHYEVEPTASDNGGGVDARTLVTLYPIAMTLTGPTPISKLLVIGQKLTANIVSSIPAHANDTYTWSAPTAGNPFSNYTASAAGAAYTPWTAPSTPSSSMSCFFAKNGSPMIACTFHSGSLNVDIPVTEDLSTVVPTVNNLAEVCGTMKLLNADNTTWQPSSGIQPNGFRLMGAIYKGFTWGIWEANTVTDPQSFSGGKFGYVQIKDRVVYVNGARSAATGLDGAFPGSGWHNANGIDEGEYSDAPGKLNLSPFPFSMSYDGRFDLYMLYKPADSAAGGSVYVPLFDLTWNADGRCSSNTGASWTQSDDGSGISSKTSYPTFPQW